MRTAGDPAGTQKPEYQEWGCPGPSRSAQPLCSSAGRGVRGLGPPQSPARQQPGSPGGAATRLGQPPAPSSAKATLHPATQVHCEGPGGAAQARAWLHTHFLLPPPNSQGPWAFLGLRGVPAPWGSVPPAAPTHPSRELAGTLSLGSASLGVSRQGPPPPSGSSRSGEERETIHTKKQLR